MDVSLTRADSRNWSKKPIVLQARGSAEWKAWLVRLAQHNRLPVPKLVDQALARHARETGFPEPPPPR